MVPKKVIISAWVLIPYPKELLQRLKKNANRISQGKNQTEKKKKKHSLFVAYKNKWIRELHFPRASFEGKKPPPLPQKKKNLPNLIIFFFFQNGCSFYPYPLIWFPHFFLSLPVKIFALFFLKSRFFPSSPFSLACVKRFYPRVRGRGGSFFIFVFFFFFFIFFLKQLSLSLLSLPSVLPFSLPCPHPPKKKFFFSFLSMYVVVGKWVVVV